MKPKISICMPTYNVEKYLPEAIESVLKQSYTDFEFIIIDDCSSDNSHEIIEKYAVRDKRIIFTRNGRNIGMVNNWNLCLQRARGEYIKFLFGDDVLASEDCLVKMAAVLDSDDRVALVGSARNVIDERSQIIKTVSKYKRNIVCEGTRIIKDCLVEQKNKIGEPSTVLFRKKHAIRGFNPGYRQIVDLEMWIHLLEQGKFAFLDEPLCSFRVHPQQQTKRNMEQFIHLDEQFQLLLDYCDKPYCNYSRIILEYMHYIPAYAVWNLYNRHHKITRQEAVDKINRQYQGFFKFIVLKPAYRLIKIFMTIKNAAAQAAGTGLFINREAAQQK